MNPLTLFSLFLTAAFAFNDLFKKIDMGVDVLRAGLETDENIRKHTKKFLGELKKAHDKGDPKIEENVKALNAKFGKARLENKWDKDICSNISNGIGEIVKVSVSDLNKNLFANLHTMHAAEKLFKKTDPSKLADLILSLHEEFENNRLFFQSEPVVKGFIYGALGLVIATACFQGVLTAKRAIGM
jgi:hypothetical protein